MCLYKPDSDSASSICGGSPSAVLPPQPMVLTRSHLTQIMRSRYNLPVRINLNLHWDELEAAEGPKNADVAAAQLAAGAPEPGPPADV